jgi:hypothetical protein
MFRCSLWHRFLIEAIKAKSMPNTPPAAVAANMFRHEMGLEMYAGEDQGSSVIGSLRQPACQTSLPLDHDARIAIFHLADDPGGGIT